jgi:hypothetical protein
MGYLNPAAGNARQYIGNGALYSQDRIGTGTMEQIPNPFGVVPRAVIIVVSDDTPTPQPGNFQAIEGTHDAQFIRVQVWQGKHYKVLGYR